MEYGYIQVNVELQIEHWAFIPCIMIFAEKLRKQIATFESIDQIV